MRNCAVRDFAMPTLQVYGLRTAYQLHEITNTKKLTNPNPKKLNRPTNLNPKPNPNPNTKP